MPSHVALVPYHSPKKRFEPRLKDAPMDFTYDRPQPGLGGTFSIAGQKRPLDTSTSMNMNSSPFPFGSASSAAYAFPFQPSLDPDLAALRSVAATEGPEVDMTGATPPRQGTTEAQELLADRSSLAARDGERIAGNGSSGPLSRVRRKHSRNDGIRRPRLGARRRRNVNVRRHDNDDDQYSSDDSADSQDQETSQQGLGRFLSVQYYMPAPSHGPAISAGSNGPAMLLGYAQFVFNASLLASFLYLLYGIIRTVQMDVADKVKEYTMDMLAENTACSVSYRANSCGTPTQAPALHAACARWERCAARDAAVVGRARVAAETFAEILNGFVDVVSWKSMLFSLLTLVIVVGATNSTLSFFRLRSRQSQHDAATHAYGLPDAPHMSTGASLQHHQDPRFLPPSAYAAHPSHPGAAYRMWSPPATPARKRRARERKGNEQAEEGEWLDPQ